jgi:allantoin racemase
MLSILQRHASPGVDVEVRHLELPPELTGPMLPLEPLYLNELIGEVIKAERDGADAAIIGCCADPALLEVQRCVKIPVMGPLQAGVAMAAARGTTVGMLSPDEHGRRRINNMTHRLLGAYGLAGAFTSVVFVPLHVEGEASLVGNTEVSAEIVEEQFRRQLHSEGVEAARKMIERDHVEAVFFGCTLWGGLIGEVDHLIDAFCIDPVVASLHMAEAQVRTSQLN